MSEVKRINVFETIGNTLIKTKIIIYELWIQFIEQHISVY